MYPATCCLASETSNLVTFQSLACTHQNKPNAVFGRSLNKNIFCTNRTQLKIVNTYDKIITQNFFDEHSFNGTRGIVILTDDQYNECKKITEPIVLNGLLSEMTKNT